MNHLLRAEREHRGQMRHYRRRLEPHVGGRAADPAQEGQTESAVEPCTRRKESERDGTAVESSHDDALGRSEMGRRFPPPGVKAVPSYGCPPFRRGVAYAGGARVWQPQNCTIRGRSPRRCGRGYSWKSALDAGWHGFPESSAVKRRRASACVSSASHGAPARRTGGGGSGGSDPPFLTAGAAPASVYRRTQWRTVNTPLGGVAPSTVIPAGRPPGALSRSRWMSVSTCSFVT